MKLQLYQIWNPKLSSGILLLYCSENSRRYSFDWRFWRLKKKFTNIYNINIMYTFSPDQTEALTSCCQEFFRVKEMFISAKVILDLKYVLWNRHCSCGFNIRWFGGRLVPINIHLQVLIQLTSYPRKYVPHEPPTFCQSTKLGLTNKFTGGPTQPQCTLLM